MFWFYFNFYLYYVVDNEMTGTIPSEIGVLTDLTALWFGKKKNCKIVVQIASKWKKKWNYNVTCKFNLYSDCQDFKYWFAYSYFCALFMVDLNFYFTDSNNLIGNIQTEIGLLTGLTSLSFCESLMSEYIDNTLITNYPLY